MSKENKIDINTDEAKTILMQKVRSIQVIDTQIDADPRKQTEEEFYTELIKESGIVRSVKGF